tara:strand:- start:63347 stop:63697 length:351 start_codon:yes stop_codon:yes gene_type:complete
MLDIVFILLIFFIVSATFITERGIDMTQRSGETAGIPVPPVLVQIDYDNAVFVNHERTDPQRVIAAVTRYRAETPDAPVLMDVHDLARHGLIVSIWDGLADKRIPAQIHRTRASEV